MLNVEKYERIEIKRTKSGKEVLFVDGVMRRDVENFADWLFEVTGDI